jgi:5-methylcytosine-specific restriction enzyme subunit McrC
MERSAAGFDMSRSSIPIENIYYLFCYAWNRFEEAQTIPVGGSASPDLPNLLAHVLLCGTRTLIRRGLDRNYQPHQEEIATVRGRIELGRSLTLQARNVRRLHCEFDELGHDLLQNQILKASLKRMAQTATINTGLSRELRSLARLMPGVSDIRLDRSIFARVQLHRNNAHYALLIKVAELAFDCLLPDPRGEGLAFIDVLHDAHKMGRVFQDFVRNFYKAEQRHYSVEPLTIAWDAVRLAPSGWGRMPDMRVDVFLRSVERRIIIDTKYYPEALQSYFDSMSFHSDNLYQIFSYLKNAAAHDGYTDIEGMLLYPCTEYSLDEAFIIQNHPVRIATVDLNQPWPLIGRRLLSLVGS